MLVERRKRGASGPTTTSVDAMKDDERDEVEQVTEPAFELDELDLDDGAGRKKGRWRWWSIGAGVVLVVIVVAMNMASPGANGAEADEAGSEAEVAEGEDETAPVPVEAVAVGTGEIAAYISATANLVAEEDVTVVSEVEGRVASLRVEEGQRVGSGAVLAVLDRGDEQIAVTKAEARAENARLAYERAEDLYTKDLLSREEHDRLMVDSEVAQQELAEAQWQLEKNTFRAPFGGTVTERMVQVGQHVRPGDELFQITDFDPMIARIFLSETDVLGLTEGREVKIALNADPSVKFRGRIRQISPVVDTATGTVKVTVEAVEAPPSVRPGSFVAIAIVRESRPDSILLPREAVVRELQASHVFVVAGETVSKRPVRLGIEEASGSRLSTASKPETRSWSRARVD